MTDEKEPREPSAQNDDDDVYVIDDAGEVSSDVLQQALREAEAAVVGETPASGVDSAEVARLREENQKLHDQVLRTLADFQNFRKRAEREKNDFFKYALSSAIQDLVPVLDNFERALASRTDAVEEFVKGVEMIYKQLGDALQKLGVRSIDAAPATFDPKIHEAILREEGTAFPANTVIEVLQKGYLLNERLIRPALVRVAVGEPSGSPAESSRPES